MQREICVWLTCNSLQHNYTKLTCKSVNLEIMEANKIVIN